MLEPVLAGGAIMAILSIETKLNCCSLHPYNLFMWYFRRTTHKVKEEDKTRGEWVAIIVRRTLARGMGHQHEELAVRSLEDGSQEDESKCHAEQCH